MLLLKVRKILLLHEIQYHQIIPIFKINTFINEIIYF